MHAIRVIWSVFLFSLAVLCSNAIADSANLLPKYGVQPKSEAQLAIDRQFLAGIDEQYKGNRKQAANDIANRGWQLLRQNNGDDAMRRFNQAWLVDKTSGSALWGMAAVSAVKGRITDSIKLFAEAERFVVGDIDFAVDYAKTIGIAGAQANDSELLKDAFTRFARLHEKVPQHTMNLQNWAITHFYVGNYSEAWKRIKLAEATPRGAEIDKSFVTALQAKMPRP
jgi:tetratricopeptide (TPR) repeat protein